MVYIYILYLHLAIFFGKCREIYHTWILWVLLQKSLRMYGGMAILKAHLDVRTSQIQMYSHYGSKYFNELQYFKTTNCTQKIIIKSASKHRILNGYCIWIVYV